MHILCPHCKNPIEVVKITSREEIACPSCGSSFRLETESTTGLERSGGQKLGKFELLGVVGSGAFGTVYKARDPELDRIVALKVPRSGNLAGPQELDRFLREARSAAQLRHPSIVSVHDVGQADSVPYLVSDFVEGVTLTDLLSSRRPGFRASAVLVTVVADALQYAHEQGVVHRDVKPSNIMIDPAGTPHVMDFGLAKRDAGEITMTMEGQVLGTPAYMPPEQARGEGHSVDARGDVYSLGVVFYQMLTGELPFRGTSRMLLHQVLHDEPKSPRGLNDKIPRDLETVCLKAMAKEPGRRYATARDLGDDLRRWLRGEPVRARPVGRVQRAVRWARRNPTAAGLLGVSGVALLALVGVVVGIVYNSRLDSAYQVESVLRRKAEDAQDAAEKAKRTEEDQRKKAENALVVADKAKQGEEAQRKVAQDALVRADHIGYLHSVFLAEAALKEDNVPLTQRRLQETKEGLRNWEWRYLNDQCYPELMSIPGQYASFSPDGARIGSVGEDHVVRIYDARTGQQTITLKGPDTYLAPIFSPDGSRIAVTPAPLQGDGSVRVYDARTGQLTYSLKGPKGLGNPVFSPDGTCIAVEPRTNIGDEGTVRVFDARTGDEKFTISRPKNTPGRLAYSPDGTRIAIMGLGEVRLHDAKTGKEQITLKGMFAFTTRPQFTPDGAYVAVPPIPANLGGDSVVRVFDARTGEEKIAFKQPVTGSPVLSPDLSSVAIEPTGAGDAAVRFYDLRTGQESLTLKGPKKLGGVTFSPDGTYVAVTPFPLGGDGTVRVYDARTGQETLALKGPRGLGYPVFSPDGARIAIPPGFSVGGEKVIRVYDVRRSNGALTLKGMHGFIFSPDSSLIATHFFDGAVRVYDSVLGVETLVLKSSHGAAFSPDRPDGVLLATVGSDGVVRLHNVRTGKRTVVLKGILKGSPARVTLVFSPDGTRIAAAGDEMLKVYDVQTGEEKLTIKQVSYMSPAFSPDGELLALRPSIRVTGGVRVYDARTGRELCTLKGGQSASDLVFAFSPDGSRIAVAPNAPAFGGGGVVRVYEARTGVEVFALKGPKDLGIPTFSPDGKYIAVAPAAGGDGIVRVYDARTGVEAVAIKGPGKLDRPVFSPDGTRIAVPSGGFFDDSDGIVRMYDARTGEETFLLRPPQPPGNSPDTPGKGIMLGKPQLGSPVFSPDGMRLAVTLGGGVRIYDAPIDLAAWQAARCKASVDRLPDWHRSQAAENEQSGRWSAGAFHWERLARLTPTSALPHFRRGLALASLARPVEAKREFETALSLKKDLEVLDLADINAELGQWAATVKLLEEAEKAPDLAAEAEYRIALLRLQKGDLVGYRRLCANAISRLGESKDVAVANTVAWTCVLAPAALADLKPAVEYAKIARPFSQGTLGATRFRAGQLADAVTDLQNAVASSAPKGRIANLLFLAMTQHQLKKPEDAGKTLAQAKQAREKNPPVLWTEKLELDLLFREAERMIPPSDAKDKK